MSEVLWPVFASAQNLRPSRKTPASPKADHTLWCAWICVLFAVGSPEIVQVNYFWCLFLCVNLARSAAGLRQVRI